MKIIVVDTSSILDALLDRTIHPEFRVLVERAKEGSIKIIIPEIVLFELTWVLQAYYKKDKQFILSLLRSFAHHTTIFLEQKNLFLQALQFFSDHDISLEDARICAVVLESKGLGLVTSDKKLQRVWKSSVL